MKKFVIAAMIAAGVAMCAAVWPHGNVVEETPVPATETAVSAQKATIVGIETEEKPTLLPEKEKRAIQQQETPQDEYSARDCAPQPLKLSIHSGGIEHPCRCR